MTPATNAQILAVVVPQIEREEGCRLAAYLDTRKIPTIGWGRADSSVHIGMTCTRQEADQWRDEKLVAICNALDQSLPWWRSLGPVRAAVLVAMAYQLGTGGLLAFHGMLSAAKVGAWSLAKQEGLDSLWAHQTPARAAREMDQLETGSRRDARSVGTYQ